MRIAHLTNFFKKIENSTKISKLLKPLIFAVLGALLLFLVFFSLYYLGRFVDCMFPDADTPNRSKDVSIAIGAGTLVVITPVYFVCMIIGEWFLTTITLKVKRYNYLRHAERKEKYRKNDY